MQINPLQHVIGRIAAVLAFSLMLAPLVSPAQTTDGYDSHVAQAVRAATQRYRLAVWAVDDGYIQTTGYIPQFGAMYTNHDRFNARDLSTPTMLVYDLAGRLVACGYQYTDKRDIPDALHSAEVSGWYDIPKHVHYNIVVNGATYYAQQPWDGDEPPTAAELIERKLMPPDATLLFSFVHPASTALIIWAWMPNPQGLFSADNPNLP